VYVLKDDLKELWDYRHSGYATQFSGGNGTAGPSAAGSRPEGVRPQAHPQAQGLSVRHPAPLPLPAAHTSVLEGINNKIKVLKRMAYGFRGRRILLPEDPRRAFPGVGR
jgi:transposase